MTAEKSAVGSLAAALWDVREGGYKHLNAFTVKTWGRMLAEAVQAEARASEGYSPEEDRRVLWAREVLAAALRGAQKCLAAVELETAAEYLLGPPRERCGKDFSAGEHRTLNV